MLPGMELLGCQIEVPAAVMQHVIKVESSFNPYAIGVVRGRLARQPRNLEEAVATAEMLEAKGFNFSLGLAQVNRYNLKKYGIRSYAEAFAKCTNLLAGSRILRECNQRAGGHWGKSFSCYYSGNFTTGYREGYVQKIEHSMYAQTARAPEGLAIPVIGNAPARRPARVAPKPMATPSERATSGEALVARRGQSAGAAPPAAATAPVANTTEAAKPNTDEAFVF